MCVQVAGVAAGTGSTGTLRFGLTVCWDQHFKSSEAVSTCDNTVQHHRSCSTCVYTARMNMKNTWMPIAKPTSAFLRAGASLVPSPVTATVWRMGPAVDA
jgi:hypothetical protein